MKKQIKGFEDYQIDEFGNVFGRNGKLMKPTLIKSGYLRIEINHTNVFIHKLVAMMFIDNPDNKPQVNHKNGIKIDNFHRNLEWMTNSENMRHAVANKLTSYDLPLATFHGSQNKPKQVEQLDISGNIINMFESVKDAKRKTGWQISGCLSGRYKTVKGYIFRYKPKEC